MRPVATRALHPDGMLPCLALSVGIAHPASGLAARRFPGPCRGGSTSEAVDPAEGRWASSGGPPVIRPSPVAFRKRPVPRCIASRPAHRRASATRRQTARKIRVAVLWTCMHHRSVPVKNFRERNSVFLRGRHWWEKGDGRAGPPWAEGVREEVLREPLLPHVRIAGASASVAVRLASGRAPRRREGASLMGRALADGKGPRRWEGASGDRSLSGRGGSWPTGRFGV
jgi:hypothetical protein